MKDFVPLGTGNSRYLKSSLASGTTWTQALNKLRNGTFPIDLGKLNKAGISQQGDPLNKATLLSDETAELFGLDQNAVPNDIFGILSKALLMGDDGVPSTPGGVSLNTPKIALVSYRGTGLYGESNPCSITFPFAPDVVLPLCSFNSGQYPEKIIGYWYQLYGVPDMSKYSTEYTMGRGFSQEWDLGYGKKSQDGKTIYWYNPSTYPEHQLNDQRDTYEFIGFKLG